MLTHVCLFRTPVVIPYTAKPALDNEKNSPCLLLSPTGKLASGANFKIEVTTNVMNPKERTQTKIMVWDVVIEIQLGGRAYCISVRTCGTVARCERISNAWEVIVSVFTITEICRVKWTRHSATCLNVQTACAWHVELADISYAWFTGNDILLPFSSVHVCSTHTQRSR